MHKIQPVDHRESGLRSSNRVCCRCGGVANTGWIDLLTGINAFKRGDGEYLVFVEENYKAKSLIYRWRP
jgi:hypothetical protein